MASEAPALGAAQSHSGKGELPLLIGEDQARSDAGEHAMAIDAEQTDLAAAGEPAMAIDADLMPPPDSGVLAIFIDADQGDSASGMPAVVAMEAPIAEQCFVTQAAADSPCGTVARPAKHEEIVRSHADEMSQKRRQIRGEMFSSPRKRHGLSAELEKKTDRMGEMLQKRRQIRGEMFSSPRKSHGLSAELEKKTARMGLFGMRAHWTADETEALLRAVESCHRSDPSFMLKAGKWNRVLQHMQEHGFSQKTAFHVQKKFQNMRWAFRNLKAWLTRKKRPLFEDLSPRERIARRLPSSHCPKRYARMEALFASTGLDDGVSKVKDEEYAETCQKSACAVRRKFHKCNSDVDTSDDSEYHQESYQSRNKPSLAIRSYSKSQATKRWCNRVSGNKRQSKPDRMQPRKQPFRNRRMRGLSLSENVDLEKDINESRLYVPSLCNDEWRSLEEDGHSTHVGEAEKEWPTDINSDECTTFMGRTIMGNDKAIDSSNGNSDRELKMGKPCVEDTAVKIDMKRDTKRRLKHSRHGIAVLCGGAANSGHTRNPRNVKHAVCDEQLGKQHSINDGKLNLQSILEQIANTNNQLSDCIRAVVMSIQNVKLILDAYQTD